jgi:hypothetical protein
MTPEQLPTLKTAISTQVDAEFVALRDAGATGAMAEWFNQAGTVIVFKTSVPTDEIFDRITWENFIPTGLPGADAAWTNRSLACQGRQFNLQTLLIGRTSLNPSKTKIRNGLETALTDVPSGTNGNTRQAGWPAVLTLLKRAATRGEQLYATGVGTDADPALLVFEGAVTDADVVQAINLP